MPRDDRQKQCLFHCFVCALLSSTNVVAIRIPGSCALLHPCFTQPRYTPIEKKRLLDRHSMPSMNAQHVQKIQREYVEKQAAEIERDAQLRYRQGASYS